MISTNIKTSTNLSVEFNDGTTQEFENAIKCNETDNFIFFELVFKNFTSMISIKKEDIKRATVETHYERDE